MSGAPLAALALFGALAAIEWRRVDQAHRVPRIAANGVVVLALLGLAWSGAPPAAEPAPGARPPAGFSSLDAPDEIILGASFTIRGAAALPIGDSGWVRLQDPIGPVDSAPVSAESPDFTLGNRPRAVGGVTYTVSLRSGARTATESLGVAVRAAVPPAVLILDASPSFETAYLKRWLAARGARLMLRTMVTRDRARVERINDSTEAAVTIGSGALQRYAAVLADAAALAALSATERVALALAVERDGLGLLLTSGAPAATGTALFAGFTLIAGDDLDRRTARPRWAGMPRRSRLAIDVAATPLLQRPGQEPLILDESGRLLAAKSARGAGAVAVTLLQAPSRWQLEGESDLFASYWSLLLAAVARDDATTLRIEGATPPVVDRAMELTLLSGEDRAHAAIVAPDGAAEPLALARDPIDPRLWRARWWPRTPGWHAVRLADREVPVLVLQASTLPSPAGESVSAATGQTLAVVSFLLLIGAVSWLWAESRRRTGA